MLNRWLIVKEIDLRRWAKRKYEEIHGQFMFTASVRWLHFFKIKHGIVTRKITKFVQNNYEEDKQEIDDKCKYFDQVFARTTANHLPKCIWNVDQVGTPKEIHSGRTLATVGTQQI